MTGVDVFKIPLRVQNSEEHRGISSDFGVIAKEAIHMNEDARGIGAQRHTRQRPLQQVGAKSGA